MRKGKARFPALTGLVAAPANAFGLDFAVILDASPAPFTMIGETAVVDVCGPLLQHGGGFPFPSYDTVYTNAVAAFDSSAKRVVLRIDSPGGDFAGSLELSRGLRALSESAKKPLIAFSDGMALSAAYAIACAASEIVGTPSAFFGSVGVWATLADQTAQDRAMGLNIAIIASGPNKADRNPHVPITAAAIDRLQAEVDGMASLFFDAVVEYRGIGRDKLEALGGSQQFGEVARAWGLADRITDSFEVFLTTIANSEASKPMGMKEEKAAYRAKLAKLAAVNDDDGKDAAKALKAMDDDEEKQAKKAAASEEEPKKEEAKAEAEEPKKEEAKAESEEPKKEETKAAASAVTAPTAVDLAARLHALEAKIVADAEAAERKELLAGRPDFSSEVRATLNAAALSTVKHACANWPRIASPTDAAAQALTPAATRGKGQGSEQSDDVPVGRESIEDLIARKMGQSTTASGIVNSGKSLTLGFMSPSDVQAALAALNKEGK